MRRTRLNSMLLAAAFAAMLLAPTEIWAQKGKKPSGGGGTSTKPYRLVALPGGGSGYNLSMNQLDPLTGTVEIVGLGGDGLAHYWVVADSATDNVLTNFSLALPATADRSNAADNSDSGVIVGSALLSGEAPTGRAVFWPDAASEPVVLPVSSGFDGNSHADAVNNNGIVVGHLSHNNGSLELAAWQILEDEFGAYGSAPTVFAWQGWVGFDVNDAGWVAATSTFGGTQQAQRFQLVWNGMNFTIAEGGGNVFGPDIIKSNTLLINQDGDVAGEQFSDGINSALFAMSVGGALLNLPTSLDKNTKVADVWSVSGINDATTMHAVQVLAEVRTRAKNGYVSGPMWGIFEENGKATMIEEATAFPAGVTFLDSLSALNNASWMCGGAFHLNGAILPVVLIPNP